MREVRGPFQYFWSRWLDWIWRLGGVAWLGIFFLHRLCSATVMVVFTAA